MVSGSTVTVDPSASILALFSFWVRTRSCGKIAEELGAEFPFSQTPPSLCSIAPAESWAISDIGKITTITPQTRLRHSSKQATALPHLTAFARITCRMVGGLLPSLMTGTGRHLYRDGLHARKVNKAALGIGANQFDPKLV